MGAISVDTPEIQSIPNIIFKVLKKHKSSFPLCQKQSYLFLLFSFFNSTKIMQNLGTLKPFKPCSQNVINVIFIHSSNFISIILKNTQISYEHTKTNYGGAVKRPRRPARTAPKTRH